MQALNILLMDRILHNQEWWLYIPGGTGFLPSTVGRLSYSKTPIFNECHSYLALPRVPFVSFWTCQGFLPTTGACRGHSKNIYMASYHLVVVIQRIAWGDSITSTTFCWLKPTGSFQITPFQALPIVKERYEQNWQNAWRRFIITLS